MPSISDKMELLLNTHQHAKRSPEYLALRLKYKALKKSHKELLGLVYRLAESQTQNQLEPEPKSCKKTKHAKRILRKYAENSSQNIPTEQIVLEEEEVQDVEPDGDELFVTVDDQTKPESELDPVIPVEDRFDNLEDQIVAEDEAEAEADVEEVDVVFEDELENAEDAEGSKEVEDAEEVEYEEVEEVEYEEVEEDAEGEEVEEDAEGEEVEEDEVEEDAEGEEVEEVEYEEDAEGEEVEEEEEEEESGVYEVEVKGVRYYTTNEQDGIVYSVTEDDDVGDEIGKFVKGKLVLNK